MTFFARKSLKLFQTKIAYLQELRFYARWSHRRPRRILTEENEAYRTNVNEVTNATELKETPIQTPSRFIPKAVAASLGLVSNDLETDESQQLEKKVKHKKPKYKLKEDSKTTDMLETVIDNDGNFVYTKLKDNDSTISQLLLTVKSHRQQIKQDLALLEGRRLIKDALEARCTLKNLIFSRKSDVEYLKSYLPKNGAKLFKIPYRKIQLWSDLTTTPGIMGIFKTPNTANFIPTSNFPITIICDNIREPGNLGAILRTAAGAGVNKVLLTHGCVDLWDTKVLRSACGAHFYLQIHKKMDWSDIWKTVNDSHSAVFLADNNVITENESDSSNTEQNLHDVIMQMPLLPYYGVHFTNFNNIALVIGGETHGISSESFRLASNFKGARLNIPLNNPIESLNAGTALGIILFEMKKQMLQNVQIKSECQ